MSGGGKIIQKTPVTLEDGRQVIQYHVMSEYRPDWFDETCVYAEPAEDEPSPGEAIWWGGSQEIYFGQDDSKRLAKVGYSFSPQGDRP